MAILQYFSPELLFFEDRKFVFGNVLNGSLLDCLNSEKFIEMTESIFRGVSKCAESCEFYAACGSFYISQKYSEMKSFDATETLACALEIKTLFKTLNEHCIT